MAEWFRPRFSEFEAGSLFFLVTIGIVAAVSTGSLFAAGFMLLQHAKPAARPAAAAAPPARQEPAHNPAKTAAATPVSPVVAHPAPTSPAPTPVRTAKPLPASPLSTAARFAIQEGDVRFFYGDLAAARFFYEQAIDAGDAAAAVRMGETFDPHFLKPGGPRRVRGDPPAARFWYQRGIALGAAEAGPRLDRLETEPDAEHPATDASRVSFPRRGGERSEPTLRPPPETFHDILERILHPQASSQAGHTKDTGP